MKEFVWLVTAAGFGVVIIILSFAGMVLLPVAWIAGRRQALAAARATVTRAGAGMARAPFIETTYRVLD